MYKRQVKERTETSGPVKNSSITTLLPLSPNFLSSIIVFTASSADVYKRQPSDDAIAECKALGAALAAV